MAIKCLKINDGIKNPNDGTTTNGIVACFISNPELIFNNRGKISSMGAIIGYFKSETTYDDSTISPLNWNNLKSRFSITISEADWDGNTNSPNDLLYNKLKTVFESEGVETTATSGLTDVVILNKA